MSTLIRPELSETNRYWIEKHRYYELKHFCLQYPLWRHAYNSLIDYPGSWPQLVPPCKTKAHNSKSVKSMSDVELRNRLNRLQMEKQYSQLSSTDVNRGKEYVSKTLKVAGTIATATSTALTIYNNYGKIKEIVNGMAKKAG